MTEINWVKLYIQMNLTTPNEVTRADLPSLLLKTSSSILDLLIIIFQIFT